MKNSLVVGETTVTRLKKSGDAETWLVVETSCEANDPDLGSIVTDALAVLSADKDLDGVEVLSTQAR
jgi:hypothetical protein